MLVLSRIKLTSTEGKDSYGLVNPVDEDSSTPYIIVDNDKTGDLEFHRLGGRRYPPHGLGELCYEDRCGPARWAEAYQRVPGRHE